MAQPPTTMAAVVRMEIRPSRWDHDPLERAVALFDGLAGLRLRGIAAEWVATGGRVRFVLRASDAATLALATPLVQLHFPQAELRTITAEPAADADDVRALLEPSDRDPLICRPGQHRALRVLRLARPAVLPLHTGFPGGGRRPVASRPSVYQAAPLTSMLATAAAASAARLAPDGVASTREAEVTETVVAAQLALAPAPRAWSDRLAAALTVAARSQPARTPAVRPAPGTPAATDALPFVLLLLAFAAGARGYLWYRAGDWLALVACGGALVVLAPLVALLVARRGRRHDLPVPALEEKQRGGAPLTTELRLVVRSADARHAEAVVDRLAASYQAFDHPAGNRLHPCRWHGEPANPACSRRRWWSLGRAEVLVAAELAALWHPGGGPTGTAFGPAPVRARHLPPPAAAPDRALVEIAGPADGARMANLASAVGRATMEAGGRVGVARHQGMARVVHLPPGLLHRHHLIVAKTRRGKSTLLVHLARAVMMALTAGGERLLLVVVDPHGDLADAVLGAVPPALEDRLTVLDLADTERPVGLNLLDPDLFPDRDRTAEQIVSMLRLVWPDNWGPRMEAALRAALLVLFEANLTRPPTERYTLLDVTPVLTVTAFRRAVLAQVGDRALHSWWAQTYGWAGTVLQQQIATPVTTKIGRFLVHEPSRLVVGQARSTLNPRALLRDGGALVVSVPVGRLGEGAAALLGATVLNLLAHLVEEQVAVSPAQRTRVVVLVDESSVLAAADYPRMLSELGKYGLSVVLVTQSLARLDAVDRQLRPALLANVDALTVFQVSAEDARLLTPELGPELAVEDLTDLPDFTCYGRWTREGERPAAFSFTVDPPPPADPARVAALRRASAARLGRPRAAVLAELEAALERQTAPLGALARADAERESTGAGGDGGASDAGISGTALTDPPPVVVRRGRNHAQSTAAKRLRPPRDAPPDQDHQPDPGDRDSGSERAGHDAPGESRDQRPSRRTPAQRGQQDRDGPGDRDHDHDQQDERDERDGMEEQDG